MNTDDIRPPTLTEILVSFRHGTINPDPKKWASDPIRDLELAEEALEALVADIEREAVDDYIQVTLGWMIANQDNLVVAEIIATLKGQLTEEAK